jgi:putative peptide zinc metalloprotease protein
MYYHMQVLYTDLSEAWRLNRRQRAVVDVGGMYFQAIFATTLLGVHWATGSVVPLYCFVVTDLAIAGSLNPFFRMDGYWLMSDLLGVPNLHAQSAALVRRAVFRLFGRPAPGPAPLPLSPGALVLFGAYSVLGLVFFVLALGFAMRFLLVGLGGTYPEVLGALWTAATARPPSALEVGSALFAAAWRGLVLFGMAKLVYNIARRFAGGCVLLLKLLLEVRGGAPSGAPAGQIPS